MPEARSPLMSRRNEHDRLIEYRGQVADFERSVLYGKRQLPPAIEAQAKKIGDQFPDLDHHELDYYVGAAWHEISNMHQAAFLQSVESVAGSNKKLVNDLTPDDLFAYYETFPDREKLEKMEDKALETYRKAAAGHWSTPRFAEQLDAANLALDLEDRIAARRLDGDERNLKRRECLGKLRALIEQLPLCGKRSEMELIYLLRSWMMEKKLDHVLAIEQGLPREDMGDQKMDLKLLLGDEQMPLQVKTEVKKDGGYRTEHYELVRQKATAATVGTGTFLVTIDTEALNGAYRFMVNPPETKGERQAATRFRKEILHSLIESVPEESAAIIRLLLSKQEEEKERPVEKITKDFLLKNSNVRHLQALGLLGNTFSPTDIAQAKNILFENASEVVRIFKTREAYLRLEGDKVDELRTILLDKVARLKSV